MNQNSKQNSALDIFIQRRNSDEQKIIRGDIYYADLSPVKGSEQGSFRPVLVVQNNIGNKYSPTIIIVPITGRLCKNALPTHVTLKGKYGLQRESIVLTEQIRAIDRSRLRDYIGHADEDAISQIDKALSVSIGI